VRLLRAELVKLRRPLLWWTVLALFALVGLIGWGGVRAAVDWYANNQPLAEHPPSCADLGLREGPECEAGKSQSPGNG
jgi:hypothetical protein